VPARGGPAQALDLAPAELAHRRKEFAISGAEHNPRIRDKQLLLFLKETLLGNHRLVRQMQRESPHFLVDDTLAGLAAG
jgi:predicted oxidoreductase